MIFLDANAFYSYIGRRNLGLIESTHVNETELSKYLDSITEKSLPTSVFIEIMVHFRDDPARLRKIIEFRLSKGLPLFNNIPDYCISEDEITCIYHMDDISLKQYAYKLLDKKIEIESRFTYLFMRLQRICIWSIDCRRLVTLQKKRNTVFGISWEENKLKKKAM